jgi:hypothetical protein
MSTFWIRIIGFKTWKGLWPYSRSTKERSWCKRKGRPGRVAQVIVHLPSKYKALSSNPSTKKERKKERKKEKKTERKKGKTRFIIHPINIF